jgi:hypothetical protein
LISGCRWRLYRSPSSAVAAFDGLIADSKQLPSTGYCLPGWTRVFCVTEIDALGNKLADL